MPDKDNKLIVEFNTFGDFAGVLDQMSCSIVISTYQAHNLFIISSEGGQLSGELSSIVKPMGVAVGANKVAVGWLNGITEYQLFSGTVSEELNNENHSHFFLPRNTHYTGNIDIHEMKYVGNELYFINTVFSCVSKIDFSNPGNVSFSPVWKPDFISELKPEDRCHLNCFEFYQDELALVSYLGESNEVLGWKSMPRDSGVILDVKTNERILENISMPHSPRIHHGRVYFLESGKGTLCVCSKAGEYEVVCQLPGYTRGLLMYGNIAIIGVSHAREKEFFGGTPIDNLEEKVCGLYVVDVNKGEIICYTNIVRGIEEIFSIEAIFNSKKPKMVSLTDPNLSVMFEM